MQTNFDTALLQSMRVDTSLDIPPLHQVLRIAVYDEYHAYETYLKVVEKFGMREPFTKIIAAEQRHIEMLTGLLHRYGVEVPLNDWPERIRIPDEFVQCCEMGVAAEIDNIAMYEDLLCYAGEYPEVQEAFFRLQAASYNNHLPAFRRCVASYMRPEPDAETVYKQFSGHGLHDSMAKLEKVKKTLMDAAGGDADPQELTELFRGIDLSFAGGVVVGAATAAMMGKGGEDEQE